MNGKYAQKNHFICLIGVDENQGLIILSQANNSSFKSFKLRTLHEQSLSQKFDLNVLSEPCDSSIEFKNILKKFGKFLKKK